MSGPNLTGEPHIARQSNTDETSLREMVMRDYVMSNFNAPQHMVGIGMAIAQHIMTNKVKNFTQFLRNEMTEDDVATAARAMNRVHAAHGVPRATQDGEKLVRAGVAALMNAKRKKDGLEPLTDEEVKEIQITIEELDGLPPILRSGKIVALKVLLYVTGVNEDTANSLGEFNDADVEAPF